MSSIYRSSDGGNTWGDFSADGSGNGTSTHTDVHTFGFANGQNGSAIALFVGNDGGVWASKDVIRGAVSSGSQHWADLNTNTGNANTSLNITQFYPGMSVHPSSDQILYGGTQGNDAQQYSGSLPWSDTLACPWDGGYTAIDPETPTTIYAACNYLHGPGTLTRNTMNGIPGDDGVNWGAIDFNNGIDFTDNADFIPPFVMDMTRARILFRHEPAVPKHECRYDVVGDFRRSNEGRGERVRDRDSRWPRRIQRDLRGNVGRVAVGVGTSAFGCDGHPSSESKRPARAAGELDCGGSCKPAGRFRGVLRIFVPRCGGLRRPRTIFYSNNSGSSWVQIDGNLPDVPVNDIVIDPTDTTDNTVYVATDSGVYASANATSGAGTTWSVLQAGLPNVQVLSLKLRNVSRTLVAGSHGRGAWNIQLPNLPAFVLTGIDPVSANAGSGDTPITTTGNGFTPQSTVNVAGATLTTTYVNATTLTANVPASATRCGGTLALNVSDPTAGTTNALPLGVVGSCDFSLSAPAPASATTSTGGSATYQFTVQLQGNSAAPVQASCPNAPAGITFSFTPNPVTPTTAGTSVGLTVSIPATASLRVNATSALAAISFLSIGALGRKRQLRASFAAIASWCWRFAAGLSARGGGGDPPPVSHTYQVTITGSAGNLMHSTSVQLVVD